MTWAKPAECLDLRTGEVVEVRSRAEILATLDADGSLDGLPFMPEMLASCGKQFTVVSRADKTCMYNKGFSLRRMRNAVHLDGARCDGSAHGGCQAACLIYWKESWLRRVTSAEVRPPANDTVVRPLCSETTLTRASRRRAPDTNDELYVCQATEIAKFTEPMKWWDFRHFVRDLKSGHLQSRLGILKSERILEKLLVGWELLRGAILLSFNQIQISRGTLGYPPVGGALKKTPTASLGLRRGDIVQIKTRAEIVGTLDTHSRNRGMSFDHEMLQYCGSMFKVRDRVDKIIDDKSGKMMPMANDCIILDGVVCKGEFHGLCPRAIFPYWREIWLEKIATPAESQTEDDQPAVASGPRR